jgi:hypothetical protein
MSRLKLSVALTVVGYILGVGISFIAPVFIALAIPAGISLAALIFYKGSMKPAVLDPISPSNPPIASSASSEPTSNKQPDEPILKDQLWGPVLEYIGVLEEMIISEGQKDNLDGEIVEKSLSLLARLNRVIPQLKELNDGNITHNIHRLVFRDLNGAINPFLKLSGSAKQQNRRLLLTGLKDINSKISFYVETIEQKDLIDLQTKVDLIHQRYNTQN